MTIWLEHGDMRAVMRRLIDEKIAVDAIVTDPPYHLTTGKKGGSGEASLNPNSPAGRSIISTGFMGKQWDGGDIAFQADTWRLCYEILPPGGHLVAFGGTRTFHRLVCAIEDAGFEIRESLLWLYGTGFPKSLDVSKAIDKEAGATRTVKTEKGATIWPHLARGEPCQGHPDRRGAAYGLTVHSLPTSAATDAAKQWDGWGTALKPACELICLARKPLIGTGRGERPGARDRGAEHRRVQDRDRGRSDRKWEPAVKAWWRKSPTISRHGYCARRQSIPARPLARQCLLVVS